MRRENKLALIVGFSVLLVVAVLVSDHLSQARQDEVGDGLWSIPDLPQPEILLDAPLASAERIRPRTGPISTEPESLPKDQDEADPGLTEPVRTAPVLPTDNRRPGWLAPDSDLASRAAPVVRDEGPADLSNGPSATDSHDSSKTSGGLFDWDAWKRSAGIRNVEPPVAALSRANPAPRPASDSPSRGHVPADGTYVVQSGDTLIGICKRLYGDGSRWPEMAELNKGRVGDEGEVYVGVTLKTLPGASTSHAAPARERGRTAGGNTRRYTVQKGDTLSLIASREVGSVRHLDAIRRLNPSLNEEGDTIFIGQRLTLPVLDGGHAKATTAETNRTTRSARTRVYIVKEGDTLSGIAERQVGSVRHLDAIRSLNASLRDGKDRLLVGQRLVLPALGG